MSEDREIGFIGLGAMGKPICQHFIEKGYSVLAWNRSLDSLEKWISENNISRDRIKIVENIQDCLSSSSGIVFSCVSNDIALEYIVCNPNGILKTIGRGGVHVCFSTVSPTIANAMEGLHESVGASYISCPVVGRPNVAVAKRLIAICAGHQLAVVRILPFLQIISQKIVLAGDSATNSNVLKLCGNFMLLSMIQAQAEAYTLAESAGVKRELAYDFIAGPNGIFNKLPLLGFILYLIISSYNDLINRNIWWNDIITIISSGIYCREWSEGY